MASKRRKQDALGSLGALQFDRNILDTISKDIKLEGFVKDHLMKVYAVLLSTLLFASLGSVAHVYFQFGGLLTYIGSILGMVAVYVTSPEKKVYRIGLLSATGFLTGCSIGPLVHTAIKIDPSIIVTALLGTATIFTCFTMTALVANRRLRLYLGGVLSSAFSIVMLLSVMRYFFTSYSIIETLYLYLGLFMFCGYVIVDTQVIIEKVTNRESSDYVWHAMELFTDFIAIFVRIVAILVENADSKKKSKKKRSE